MLPLLAARSRLNHSNIVPVSPVDPYFDFVSALLHFEELAGDYIDVTGRIWTGSGLVTIDGVQPKWGMGALHTTGGNIQTGSSVGLGFGDGEYTVEGWSSMNATGDRCLFDNRFAGQGIGIYATIGSGSGNFSLTNNSSIIASASVSLAVSPDYSHWAVCRDNVAGLTYGYIDGVKVFEVADTRTFASPATAVVGAAYTGGQPYSGWQDDVRITKGICRYPGGVSFSVPDAPFPNTGPSDALWDNVLSLLHCEGIAGTQVFTDQRELIWAAGGGDTELTNAQLGMGRGSLFISSSTGPSTHGGIATSDTDGFHTGTGPLSLEWLQYWNDLTDFQNIYSYGGTAAGGLLLETGNGDGKYIVYLGGTVICAESTAPSTGQWYQYSMVRNEAGVFTIARAPLGMTPVVTATSGAQVASIGIDGESPTWGAYASGANATASIIDELRITAAVRPQNVIQINPWPNKGTRTEDPYWSDVKLLCNYNGADGATTTVDSSPVGKTLTMVTSALDTDNPKFGTASVVFSGSGSVNAPDDGDWDVADQDFTIDGWFYQNASGGFQQIAGIWDDFSNNNFHIGVNPSNTSVSVEYTLGGIYDAARSFGIASVFTVNTWTHFEFSRHGAAMNIFINGELVYTFNCGTDIVHYTATIPLRMGGNTLGQNFNGWLDDIRFTKGVARHTADFTPPTHEYGQFNP